MIGIITVFYSENFGSYLQAYALKKTLEVLGYESVFIFTGTMYSHTKYKTLLSVGNKLLHGDPKNAWLAVKKYKYFSKALSDDFFKYIPQEEMDSSNIDTLVLGSDTLWNVEYKYFKPLYSLFWPTEFYGKRIVSYASSVANSKVEDIRNLEFPEKSLERIDALSVRDMYSYKVISELTTKNIELVCDPTFLLDKEEYSCFFIDTAMDKYIALYLFETISEECVSRIVRLAKDNHLMIISIGKYYSWCDKYVDPSVENFVSYIKNADYVFTNTFHGTIFSIIFEKQFTIFGSGKKKITTYVSTLDLSNRISDGKKIDERNLIEYINYTDVNIKKQKLIENSISYLKRNI